ncbi:hypothetical protein P280DRAFT_289607 [Massarina eburnea CBS 473.64]|uniref:Uncharacterized protein n=1 Tax=Massarina eburnea CBS 473.64 TaxID=1395130 RepID=A0A6A6S268_9PLEO|nr:hypothetical protein P280DRAFT_289607 [Massarina eburnea CBS 473.64]
MPSKLPWSKSNRSHASIDTSSGHPSPVPSGNPSAIAVNDPNADRYPSPDRQQVAQSPQPPGQQISPGGAQSGYRQQFPQRTTSHRHSANVALDPQNLHQLQNAQQQPPPAYELQKAQAQLPVPRRGSYQPQSQHLQEPPKQKQSLRSRLGLSSHKDDDAKTSKAEKVARRVSVRKSDPRAQDYQAQEHSRLQAAQWQRHGGSSSHLPASPEHDERDNHLDPFLQREEDSSPRVPPKDNFQGPPPQYSHNISQEQFRPPVARVNTEGSYHTQGGGVVDYSPEHQQQGLQPHHQQQQQQHQQQQQQYQSYQPAPQPQPQPQKTSEYQAFNPNAPSPLITNAQQHPSPEHASQHQQSYYQYQAQQQTQQQAQQKPSQGPQGPQDPPAQNIHYSQQTEYSPPPQPHQSQDSQPIQHSRAPSQAQAELKAPPPTQPLPQIVANNQPSDGQHLQQLRPPSSQAHVAPPSPLQPQGAIVQAYDSNPQGQQPQAAEPHPQNKTPPQQTQDTMPPGTQRNTLRKVNDAGQPPSGPPTREGSLLSQNPTQGQAHGQPPLSPGPHQTFGANVVPTASQGQPYRGEKGQPPSNAELGRATPPPRTASDMSDEEISALVKEHDVLREKYQKVKRYFFEQQNQVHQLQNTLANQRLSLSRTAWDDSEYSTRFGRLDGLIAQLSFAVRKDWKEIPQWLHGVVNKNAVETGKQEMTAVGRAFISRWLVENIFDKYFHPDLETGFSTQLKNIQLNIRKRTAIHSIEDEEGLIAKVINWRLATVEGLADLLETPAAAANRETLTDKLKEQLIGELQMYLKEPAPPDLAGNVPMIIELAISVAQHLPLESREVHIEYFYPGSPVQPDLMKLESGIPALTVPIEQSDDADRASLRSVVSKGDDSASIAEQEQQASQNAKDHSKKHSIFGFGGPKKSTPTPASLGKRESVLGQGGSQLSLSQPTIKEDPPASKVRLAIGFAVQIRGKSILVKAPVYSTT